MLEMNVGQAKSCLPRDLATKDAAADELISQRSMRSFVPGRCSTTRAPVIMSLCRTRMTYVCSSSSFVFVAACGDDRCATSWDLTQFLEALRHDDFDTAWSLLSDWPRTWCVKLTLLPPPCSCAWAPSAPQRLTTGKIPIRYSGLRALLKLTERLRVALQVTVRRTFADPAFANASLVEAYAHRKTLHPEFAGSTRPGTTLMCRGLTLSR